MKCVIKIIFYKRTSLIMEIINSTVKNEFFDYQFLNKSTTKNIKQLQPQPVRNISSYLAARKLTFWIGSPV